MPGNRSGRARSNRSAGGAEIEGEFVDAGMMAVGEGTEEVETKELRETDAETGTSGCWHKGEGCGWQQGHGRHQRQTGQRDWKRRREIWERSKRRSTGNRQVGVAEQAASKKANATK